MLVLARKLSANCNSTGCPCWPRTASRGPFPAGTSAAPSRPRTGAGRRSRGVSAGWNAEQEFCDSADDHHAAADEIADEQPEKHRDRLEADLTPVDRQLLAGMDVERVAENLFGGERGYRLFFART